MDIDVQKQDGVVVLRPSLFDIHASCAEAVESLRHEAGDASDAPDG